MRLFPLLLLLLLNFAVWQPVTVSAETGPAAGPGLDAAEEDHLLELAQRSWTGDLDGILERGFVRVATANNPLYFSADGIDRRGLAVEVARELEKFLAKAYPKKGRHINVVLLPMARDALLPAVIEGRADIAAANLTITAERSGKVAFTDPTNTGVRELVVTGPAATEVSSFDDLVDMKLHLRRSSSYFEHLGALNAEREAAGKARIPVEEMDEYLEDYDLLEMANSGLLPAIVVDSHKAAVWQQVFDKIKVHENLALNEGGEIGWAVRKENPGLLAATNKFIQTIRKGTMLGNVLIKRYVKNPKWIENVRAEDALGRYEQTLDIIRKYAAQYDFDWLMITAQGYQESKLDQSKRSKVGAIGIMQVMPQTAKDPNVNIPDITKTDNNVHAGVRYLRFLRDTYFDDPAISPLDQTLFSFAAYNAGPGNMNKARRRAAKMDLDPNVWFNNVEIAIGKAVSREPVIYVRNIYKYYVAYKLIEKTRAGRKSAAQ
ncbi:lytic transglycosylase F [Pelagibius marinus]|uniref:transglycosylase SLT domain-containing protein n=1 Tax=Pelagibius marinus TaxID=2762760 RepID=UPI001872A334|nr:lytic transglycosylase F [Pelagibius marinus]